MCKKAAGKRYTVGFGPWRISIRKKKPINSNWKDAQIFFTHCSRLVSLFCLVKYISKELIAGKSPWCRHQKLAIPGSDGKYMCLSSIKLSHIYFSECAWQWLWNAVFYRMQFLNHFFSCSGPQKVLIYRNQLCCLASLNPLSWQYAPSITKKANILEGNGIICIQYCALIWRICSY